MHRDPKLDTGYPKVGQDSEQQDGFLYGLIVRVTPWLYNERAVMSYSTRQRQQQQMLFSFQLVQPYQMSYCRRQRRLLSETHDEEPPIRKSRRQHY